MGGFVWLIFIPPTPFEIPCLVGAHKVYYNKENVWFDFHLKGNDLVFTQVNTVQMDGWMDEYCTLTEPLVLKDRNACDFSQAQAEMWVAALKSDLIRILSVVLSFAKKWNSTHDASFFILWEPRWMCFKYFGFKQMSFSYSTVHFRVTGEVDPILVDLEREPELVTSRSQSIYRQKESTLVHINLDSSNDQACLFFGMSEESEKIHANMERTRKLHLGAPKLRFKTSKLGGTHANF